MRARRFSADGRYEYVVEVESVSLLEDRPLFAARLVHVIDQETGMEVAERSTTLEAYGETPDDAFARVTERADRALTDR